MVRNIIKYSVLALGLLALTAFTPQAKAGTIDFSCGGSNACTGTMTISGSDISVSGLGHYSSSMNSNYWNVTNFATSGGTGVFTISDGAGDYLTGNIVAVSILGTVAALDINWTGFSPSVVSYLGGYTAGSGGGSIIDISSASGSVTSSDLSVVTPEPASLILLGTGLLGLGGAVRRRWAL